MTIKKNFIIENQDLNHSAETSLLFPMINGNQERNKKILMLTKFENVKIYRIHL
jgi:hypothetical protein